ncbi:MAG: nucleotidyltransferase family protein [Verrucomicrobiota bacterium]|nr:nucleotidyltransferase family protein [Verrucomicrobiota bacterium]
MKLIILAAGYATRLYPLTLNRPKPLLPIAGRPMVDHVLKSLASISAIDHVYLVTNEKFAGHFEEWSINRDKSEFNVPVAVVNDHSTDDSNKLGAIGDLSLVIKSQKIDDDVIVVAGDNLFSDDLGDYGRVCEESKAPVLGVYDVESLKESAKYGVVEVSPEGNILTFEEKPDEPKSTLIGIALYHYPRNVLPLIEQYIADGNNPDQPGRLIQWLYPQMPVQTWSVPGTWYDIGSKETLEEADCIFTEKLV